MTPTPEELVKPCTCHPDDDRPVPCQHKYAFHECVQAERDSLRSSLARLTEANENLPCGHRKRDCDDSYGACVFCLAVEGLHEFEGENIKLTEANERLQRDAERCQLTLEDDGDYGIEIYADRNRVFSMSVHKDGNINWAGLLDGESGHGVIKDTEMGRFAFRIAAIAAQGGGD